MRQLAILLLLFLPFLSFSQVKVFETFEDFKADKGTEYEKYSHATDNGKLILFDKGKRSKVGGKDCWGFTYKDNLFRFTLRNYPVMLVSEGSPCYWEAGMAHLRMLKENTNEVYFVHGEKCNVSVSLDSEICPMPQNKKAYGHARKDFNKFKKANPELKAFYSALLEESYWGRDFVKKCVEENQIQ